MTTFYDAAIRNFRAAADVLAFIQATRLDLVNETRTGLVGRPKLILGGNYNNITSDFGACLPAGARADVFMAEDDNGIELRCSDAEWMTLEGNLPVHVPAETVYLEMQASSDKPIVVDVFIREFFEDGSVRDVGHRECHLAHNNITVCNLTIPASDEHAIARRVIVHLRQPTRRLILGRLAATLL